MVVINIVQAILIDRINSIVWITVFPGVVLILFLAAIALHGTLSREKLVSAWKDTTRETPQAYRVTSVWNVSSLMGT